MFVGTKLGNAKLGADTQIYEALSVLWPVGPCIDVSVTLQLKSAKTRALQTAVVCVRDRSCLRPFSRRFIPFSCIFSRVLRDSTPRYVGRSVGWLVGPLLGSGQEADNLYFHRYREFSSPSSPSPPSHPPQSPASRPKIQSRGPNSSLEAQISASRPKSSLEVPIPAWRLQSQPGGSNPSCNIRKPKF